MGIGRKIALLQIILCVSFICVIVVMSQLVWGKNYLNLEQENVKDNATRTYLAWDEELNHLGSQVGDWSPWDDLFIFARSRANTDFAEKNLSDDEMANLRINLAFVTTPNGEILYGKAIDLASGTEVKVPKEVRDLISNLITNHIVEPEILHYKTAFVVVKGQPLLLAMQRILTSDNKGPSTGVIVFAKYADAALLREISKRTQVKLSFAGRAVLPEEPTVGFSQQIANEEEILCYYPILDAYGSTKYLVSATPRFIYHQGKVQMKSFLVFTVAFGAFLIIITLLLLNRVILSKVRKMDSFMNSIVAGNDYSIRIDLPGKDELSKVASTMNNMLQQIELSHRKIEGLLDTVKIELEERRKAEETLKYLSMHDQLTGLYNRTFFEREIDNISEQQIQGIGIVCCDLDGLKIINDTMGHHVGDKILAETAETLRQAFGDNAIVARIGGDEFAVLLANIHEEEIYRVCEQIKDIKIKDPEGRGVQLHLSLGWSYYGGSNLTKNVLQDLIKQADDLMYRQKLSSSHSNRNALVQGMLELLKVRDFITEGHSMRLQQYAESLGKAANIKEVQIADLSLLAKFHDIGKVGISDAILLKPGPLTSEERKEMERHSEIGHRIAQAVPELLPIGDYILKHHEWWNGEGYPLGLKGEEIPIEDRIIAIADSYDAMTSDRPYRKALSSEAAIAELRRFSGIQFEPDLVEKFITLVFLKDISKKP